MGLVALIAVGAAGAGVGAGLGSLPGKPGLPGASGHPPVQAISAAPLAGGPLATPGGSVASRSPLTPPAALGSLAGALTKQALAGGGVCRGTAPL